MKLLGEIFVGSRPMSQRSWGAFLCAAVAVIVIFYVTASIYLTGANLGQVRSLLSSQSKIEQAGLVEAVLRRCRAPGEERPKEQAKDRARLPLFTTDECQRIGVDYNKEKHLVFSQLSPCKDPSTDGAGHCPLIWQTASAQAHSANQSAVSEFLKFISPEFILRTNGAVSLTAGFVLLCLFTIIFLMAAGQGLHGNIWGLVINKNGRVSLTLSQIAFWTIVIINGYAAMTAFNIGLSTAVGASAQSWTRFPDIPAMLLALMAITVGLAPINGIINSWRPRGDDPDSRAAFPEGNANKLATLATAEVRRVTAPVREAAPAGVAVAGNAQYAASFFDLFMNEDAGKANEMSLSRAQSVLITLVLGGAYVSLIGGQLGQLQTGEILATGMPAFKGLPDVAGSFLTLLTISHVGYLAGKFETAGDGSDAGEGGVGGGGQPAPDDDAKKVVDEKARKAQALAPVVGAVGVRNTPEDDGN